MSKPLRITLVTIGFIIICFASLLLYLTFTEYKPADKIALKTYNTELEEKVYSDTITCYSWNIGYAGLGREMDFFYEGGEMVKPTLDLCHKYMDGVTKTLETWSDADFILLQEIDIDSKRSYFNNQLDIISSKLNDYYYNYATNYNVQFVPLPVYSPMGKVSAGLATFAKYIPDSSIRYAFPQIQPWPNSLAMLKKGFIENRYSLPNGKQLVVFHTHNSFFQKDSTQRYRELNVLKNKMTLEYKKGNYVIAGGDWNQTPLGFEPKDYPNIQNYVKTAVNLCDGYFPRKWKIVYDAKTPTTRFNDMPYKKGKSKVSYIDYFIISPNVKNIDCKTIDLEFKYSDHNPVKITAILQ
ncbi:MAG: endonuclease/exonuclease/phosphatase family protein [Hyphomicrobiales bacterium]